MKRARTTLTSTLLAAFLWTGAAPGLAAEASKTPPSGAAMEAVALYHNYCSVCHGEKKQSKQPTIQFGWFETHF